MNMNNMQRSQSPALHMAMRIRAEQGIEQARRYLIAMEPYLAPAERSYIANQLGISLPPPQQQRQNNPPPRSMMDSAQPAPNYSQAPQQNVQDFGYKDASAPRTNPFVPPVTGGNTFGGEGAFGANNSNNAANFPLQLLQLLSAMNGGASSAQGGISGAQGGAQGGGMNNPMQMMQLLGMLNALGLFGKK